MTTKLDRLLELKALIEPKEQIIKGVSCQVIESKYIPEYQYALLNVSDALLEVAKAAVSISQENSSLRKALSPLLEEMDEPWPA